MKKWYIAFAIFTGALVLSLIGGNAPHDTILGANLWAPNSGMTVQERATITNATSSFSVSDNSSIPASSAYVDVGVVPSLSSNATQIFFHNVTGTNSTLSPGAVDLVASDQGNYLVTGPVFASEESPASITTSFNTNTVGDTLRFVPDYYNGVQGVIGHFATQLSGAAGSPTSSAFQDTSGVIWPVFNEVTSSGFIIQQSQSGLRNWVVNTPQNNLPTAGSAAYVIHPTLGFLIRLTIGSSVGDTLYFNPTTTLTARINGNVSGGVNITTPVLDYTSVQNLSYSHPLLFPIYICPNASQEDRLQHTSANAPFDLFVPLYINKSIKVKYNALAAASCYRLRALNDTGAFVYDNTSTVSTVDTKFISTPFLRPNQATISP